MTSKLEDIPGIGPRRRASLLKHFGGLVGLKAAGEAEIAKVEGITTPSRHVSTLTCTGWPRLMRPSRESTQA